LTLVVCNYALVRWCWLPCTLSNIHATFLLRLAYWLTLLPPLLALPCCLFCWDCSLNMMTVPPPHSLNTLLGGLAAWGHGVSAAGAGLFSLNCSAPMPYSSSSISNSSSSSSSSSSTRCISKVSSCGVGHVKWAVPPTHVLTCHRCSFHAWLAVVLASNPLPALPYDAADGKSKWLTDIPGPASAAGSTAQRIPPLVHMPPPLTSAVLYGRQQVKGEEPPSCDLVSRPLVVASLSTAGLSLL
jgi:hypothetical protein